MCIDRSARFHRVRNIVDYVSNQPQYCRLWNFVRRAAQCALVISRMVVNMRNSHVLIQLRFATVNVICKLVAAG